MAKIVTDISDLPERLLAKGIEFLTQEGIFYFNTTNSQLEKNLSHTDKSTVRVVHYWIIFSTGIEMLIKSVLLKHNCLNFNKKRIETKIKGLNKSASNYSNSLFAYNFISSFEVTSSKNAHILNELKSNDIHLLYEVNLGTLGDCQSKILKLKCNNIISEADYSNLYNSIQVLLDLRRNFDIHNYSNLNVLGSINGDLDNLYLPMINLLLKL